MKRLRSTVYVYTQYKWQLHVSAVAACRQGTRGVAGLVHDLPWRTCRPDAVFTDAREHTLTFLCFQVRRLKMYNSGRPVRDRKGKIVSQELQSKELPTTRIVPDRRWFGNTRVVGQKQLQSFREQMAGKADNPFAVLLRQRKLPLQVLPAHAQHSARI